MIFCSCRSEAREYFFNINEEDDAMKMSYALCLLITVFSVSAVAADESQGLKQEVQKVAATYAENFNKHDAAGIAALYVSGGMHVNPNGPTTDVAKRYEGVFKAGFNHS
jgi:hypothetical protein